MTGRQLIAEAAHRAGEPWEPTRNPTGVLYWQVDVEVLLKRWVARDGERAQVSECEARGVPGAPGTSCLICETDAGMRRIWSYPVDWHRLEDAKILALFDQPFVPAPAAPATAPAKPARPGRTDGGQGATPMQAVA